MAAKKKTKRNPTRKIARKVSRLKQNGKRVARAYLGKERKAKRVVKRRAVARRHKRLPLWVVRVDQGNKSFWLNHSGRLIDKKSEAVRGSLSTMKTKARGIAIRVPKNVTGIWLESA